MLTLRAHAKVNLHLYVGPPRADGYHPLATVYQAVSLYDEVQAEWADPDEFGVTVSGEEADQVPLDDSNLAVRAAKLLAMPPRDVMLVAAHKDDLAAARRCGFQTAFVNRPFEFGRKAARDVEPDPRSTINAGDFIDLAGQLGA